MRGAGTRKGRGDRMLSPRTGTENRQALPESREPVSAHARALEALARRARSCADLARWLRDRDYAPEEIDETVARLVASGLLNDAQFARAFARTRLVDRKLSRRRVQAELGRHGVAREIVDVAIAEAIGEESVDEEATVRAVAERKFRSLARLDHNVAKRRLVGFLARRGYDGATVRRVVRELTAR